MAVIPVMDTIIVMKCSLHRSNKLGLLITLTLFIFISHGCQKPASDVDPPLGKVNDVTEDLYHRLNAGLFKVGFDPLIFHVVKNPNLYQILGLPFYNENATNTMVRLSWDRGSFWVKTDDHGLVVVYMDEETIFSHVQIATLEGFSSARQFTEFPEHPIR